MRSFSEFLQNIFIIAALVLISLVFLSKMDKKNELDEINSKISSFDDKLNEKQIENLTVDLSLIKDKLEKMNQNETESRVNGLINEINILKEDIKNIKEKKGNVIVLDKRPNHENNNFLELKKEFEKRDYDQKSFGEKVLKDLDSYKERNELIVRNENLKLLNEINILKKDNDFLNERINRLENLLLKNQEDFREKSNSFYKKEDYIVKDQDVNSKRTKKTRQNDILN